MHTPLSCSQGSGITAERVQREHRSQRRWRATRKSLLDTAVKLHIETHSNHNSMHKAYASPSRNKSQHGEEGWAHNSTPIHGTNDNRLLLGEILCSKSIVFSKLTILQWKTTWPRILGSASWSLKKKLKEKTHKNGWVAKWGWGGDLNSQRTNF